MKLTQKNLDDTCGLIQDDLITFFDGIPREKEVLTQMCQLIVNRFKVLKAKWDLDIDQLVLPLSCEGPICPVCDGEAERSGTLGMIICSHCGYEGDAK